MLALTALTVLSLWLWTPDVPPATLQARYLTSPSDLRPVGPWQLHVRDSGPPAALPDAPAVVLLHGFASSLQTWDAWAEGLATTHRVIRIDLPGSGLSPPDPAHDYRDERSWQLLIALLDKLGLARASVVGHSMGGLVSLILARDHADVVERLMVVDVPAFFSVLITPFAETMPRRPLEPAPAPEPIVADEPAAAPAPVAAIRALGRPVAVHAADVRAARVKRAKASRSAANPRSTAASRSGGTMTSTTRSTSASSPSSSRA